LLHEIPTCPEGIVVRRIGVDVQSGESDPSVLIAGCEAALSDRYFLHLYGDVPVPDEQRVVGRDGLVFVPCSERVTMQASPWREAHRRRNTAMHRGFADLAAGTIDAFISSGNSGVVLALAVRTLGCQRGIRRPAFAVPLPSTPGPCVLLDVGANATCRPVHYLDFARLGREYLQRLREVERPSVALLSNGSEKGKGTPTLRKAAALLEKHGDELCFIGAVEANELFEGRAEVVLCDGFTGNVVLKAMEGLTNAFVLAMKEDLRRHPRSSEYEATLCRVLARFDHRAFGGAPLLGVRGLCLVAHGVSGAREIAAAIAQAARLLELEQRAVPGAPQTRIRKAASHPNET